MLGPLRLGPVVGVGLPNLVSFGGALKLTRYFGAGINVGLIPTLRIEYYGEAKVSYQQYDVYGRIYPFGGGFFLGAGVGYARAKGTHEKSTRLAAIDRVDPSLTQFQTSSRGSVQAMVLTPQIGYFQVFRSGFCMGADVGAQIPIAPGKIEVETEVSDEITRLVPNIERYIEPGEREVKSTLESVARTPIPTFNFRVGWML